MSKHQHGDDLAKHLVVLWPPISDSSSDVSQWMAVLSWFAGHLSSRILIPIAGRSGAVVAPPEHASAASLVDVGKIELCDVEKAVSEIMSGGAITLIHQRELSEVYPSLHMKKLMGSVSVTGVASPRAGENSTYYYIGSPHTESQDAYFAVCLTYWLAGGEDKSFLEASYRMLMQIKGDASQFRRIGLFGTGPSLAEAVKGEYSDSLNLICNTIVKNKRFCDQVNPRIIVASDAHFHFSYHRYSARFLADLANRLEESDAVFFTFDKFAAFVRWRLPNLAAKIFGIPAGRDTYGFNFDTDFRLYPGDSVLNMFLLPLGSFLGQEVILNGFTGRAPSDDYFWSHLEDFQYPELLGSVRQAHPAFFANRDYGQYADNVDDQISLRVRHAREMGKTIASGTTTFYKALQS